MMKSVTTPLFAVLLTISAVGCFPSPSYDSFGFNSAGVHRNGTRMDGQGYDAQGYDAHGFSRAHYLPWLRFHRNGTLFDDSGYTFNGFDRDRNHRVTGTQYDPEGYDWAGFNDEGYNRDGQNQEYITPEVNPHPGTHSDEFLAFLGFNEDGQHQNGTEYYHLGFNSHFFTRSGTHALTGTPFDPEGYDHEGYNTYGYDREGYRRDGYNTHGLHRDGVRYRFPHPMADSHGLRAGGGGAYSSSSSRHSELAAGAAALNFEEDEEEALEAEGLREEANLVRSLFADRPLLAGGALAASQPPLSLRAGGGSAHFSSPHGSSALAADDDYDGLENVQ